MFCLVSFFFTKKCIINAIFFFFFTADEVTCFVCESPNPIGTDNDACLVPNDDTPTVNCTRAASTEPEPRCFKTKSTMVDNLNVKGKKNINSNLTHWGRVTHICVSKLAYLVQIMACAWKAPSHYLNQCWNIVNWTSGNKLKCNLNRNLYFFIQANAFENVVWKMAAILSRPQCVLNPNITCGVLFHR